MKNVNKKFHINKWIQKGKQVHKRQDRDAKQKSLEKKKEVRGEGVTVITIKQSKSQPLRYAIEAGLPRHLAGIKDYPAWPVTLTGKGWCWVAAARQEMSGKYHSGSKNK